MADEIIEPDKVEGAPHPRHTVDLIGQKDAEGDFLQAFNQGRLHHGWLITGPRGVGKATLAWKIARFLLSQPVPQSDSLLGAPEPSKTLTTPPDHPVAQRIAALSEPGLFLCRRPWDHEKSRLKQAITVDEVRKLNRFFGLSAADGGRRVVIIDAADEMNRNAANALLKLLEEPPKNATLLLVSHRPMALLPTIRSRCRVLKCRGLEAASLSTALVAAGFDASMQTGRLGGLSGGSVGEAIRLLALDGLAIYRDLLDLLNSAPKMDRNRAIALASSCVGKAAEARYDLVLRLLALMLGRLAKSGVTLAQDQGLDSAEAQIMGAKCQNADQARCWANLAQELQTRAAHGRAVNLDPATVILDMLLKINQTAGRLPGL